LAGALLAIAGVTNCSSSPESEEQVFTLVNELQYGYIGLQGDTTKGVNLLTSQSNNTTRAKSVGALRYRKNLNSGNCGATFVSKTLAVTAGHCVADLAKNDAVTIEQYNTTNFQTAWLFSQALVSGTWNGTGYQFNQYFDGTRVGPAQGYNVTPWACTVERKCDIPSQCPGSANVKDLAVIKCPNRTWNNWVTPLAATPANETNIEVRWFHELLYLATSSTPYNSYQPDFNYLHYFLLSADRLNNYHYYYNAAIDQPLQLFPLLSIQSAANQPYRVKSSSSTHVSTNIPACHGMSGSGVFLANSNSFAGVVLTGSQFLSNHLCDEMNTTGGGSFSGMGFMPPSIVKDSYQGL
jgi:V8-like Glu-specific endopeptidase